MSFASLLYGVSILLLHTKCLMKCVSEILCLFVNGMYLLFPTKCLMKCLSESLCFFCLVNGM